MTIENLSRKSGCQLTTRRFSLLEILVVVAIIALILALVIPKVGRIPKRLTVARSLTTIRRAMRETGMRSRTSGQTIRLMLDLQEKRFEVQQVSDTDVKEFFLTVPEDRQSSPANGNGDGNDKPSKATDTPYYEIPQEVEWRDDFSGYDVDMGPSFMFHPNGEASGDPLEFSVEGRNFRLDVDRLIGTPIITETINR